MGSEATTRAKRAAPGRQRILREARALFVAHGYAAVSMQQIADAAQVNKATLFHHFGDKEGLFLAVMREEINQVHAMIQAEVEAGGSLRDQLRRLAGRLLTMRKSDFGRLGHDVQEHLSEQAQRELMGKQMLPWQFLTPVFERAIAAGEMRPIDPAVAVSLFVGAIALHSQRIRFADDAARIDPNLAAKIADVVMDGIGAGPRGA